MAGCAGVFVFSWTDEWHRGGFEVDDWDFGLVDSRREPKLALAAVARAFAELPFPKSLPWPRISVVVCAYNSAETLPSCLAGLKALEYPDYEVIVVNDGSTDATAQIVEQYGFRLISTENRGLASARNSGLEAASGEIIAYLDADARPGPHWLSHLAASFLRSSHSGVGGPNIPPPGDGAIASCVANAPGGPTHVLLSDREAEHIPGCNMAFRKARLEAIGGFDPQFRIAGDDVDICWQLQDRGLTVGFSAGAVVWHHRRRSIRAYARQQYEYGKAEALLERKWPDRYNRVGHLAWSGRVYGNGATKALGWRRWKIYYGTWGTGLFQSVYQRAPGALASLPLVPEWYLVIIALAGISALGAIWTPLLLALPLLGLACGALLFESLLGAARASFRHPPRRRRARLRLRGMTAFLYMLQPLARLSGRLRHGLAPWRRRSLTGLALPRPRTKSIWSERWESPDERLQRIEDQLRLYGCAVLKGSEFDRWDLQVRGGMLGVARLRMAVEEHGGGRQLARFRSWPEYSRLGAAFSAGFAALAVGAALSEDAAIVFAVLATAAIGLLLSAVRDCATASGVLLHAIEGQAELAEARAHSQQEHRTPAVPELAAASLSVADTLSDNGRLPSTASLNGDDGGRAGALDELPSQVVPFSPRHE
jgi:glycosyltransferase involved in cell wall biosynthesis